MKSREYNLASVSGDGKFLIWTLKNKLKHPVHGFILAPKTRNIDKNVRALGGTSIAVNSVNKMSTQLVVGSEGGAVFRCSVHPQSGPKTNFEATGHKWSSSAKRVIESIQSNDKSEVVRHVVAYAKQRGIRDIALASLYASKPPISHMYPSCMDFHFDQHTGPVNDISWSPFHRSLFLTCSVDGSVRLYHALQVSRYTAASLLDLILRLL